ncbi:MAG: EamA family transporter [Alphaproteobacteria bacterium]|nr:EamA family transporter [Alphaproteobacteria bacterium]
MTPTALAALLVICAALFSAAYNTIIKVGEDRLVVGAMAGGVAFGLAALALPFVAPPPPAAWPFLAVSIAAQTAYYFIIVEAYRDGDLSLVYPVMRGTSLAVIVGFSVAGAGEPVTLSKAGGLALLFAGIALAVDLRAWRRPGARRPALYAAVTGFCVGIYLLADGFGARRSPDPLGYVAWMFLLSGVPVTVAVTVLRRGAFARAWRRNWRHGVASGAVMVGGYGAVVCALSLDSFASVAALRELTTVFTILIARFLLEERPPLRRWAAVALIVLGAAVINA